jgi:phage-related protein
VRPAHASETDHLDARQSRGSEKIPKPAQHRIGFALKFAQAGEKHADAKPLKGFGGAGVLEIVEDFAGDAYRAVYTVKFEEAIYVLHAFQKKSKSGISTPKREMDLIAERLKRAKEMHLRRAHEPK